MDLFREPCPFCGSDNSSIYWKGWRYNAVIYFVKCEECGAQTRAFSHSCDDANKWKGSPAEWDNDACGNALHAWNRRPA